LIRLNGIIIIISYFSTPILSAAFIRALLDPFVEVVPLAIVHGHVRVAQLLEHREIEGGMRSWPRKEGRWVVIVQVGFWNDFAKVSVTLESGIIVHELIPWQAPGKFYIVSEEGGSIPSINELLASITISYLTIQIHHLVQGSVEVWIIAVIEIFIFLQIIKIEEWSGFNAAPLLHPSFHAAVQDLYIFMAVNSENPIASARPLAPILIV